MKINIQKQVQGQIADASGHTDFVGTLDEAVATIFEGVQKSGKWAYINGTPFNFERFDDVERAEVYNALNAAEEPFFTLTGKLQGGAKTIVRTRSVRRPISQLTNRAATRAQLVVNISTRDGVQHIETIVSEFGKAKSRLQKVRAQVLDSVVAALR